MRVPSIFFSTERVKTGVMSSNELLLLLGMLELLLEMFALLLLLGVLELLLGTLELLLGALELLLCTFELLLTTGVSSSSFGRGLNLFAFAGVAVLIQSQ